MDAELADAVEGLVSEAVSGEAVVVVGVAGRGGEEMGVDGSTAEDAADAGGSTEVSAASLAVGGEKIELGDSVEEETGGTAVTVGNAETGVWWGSTTAVAVAFISIPLVRCNRGAWR